MKKSNKVTSETPVLWDGKITTVGRLAKQLDIEIFSVSKTPVTGTA